MPEDKKISPPTKEDCIRDLDFIEKILEKSRNQVSSNSHLNLSIFYGLAFGIVGNLAVSSFFAYQNKPTQLYFWLIMISLIIIMLVCIVVSVDHRRFRKFEEEIKDINMEISGDRDRLEAGDMPKHRSEFFNKYTMKINQLR